MNGFCKKLSGAKGSSICPKWLNGTTIQPQLRCLRSAFGKSPFLTILFHLDNIQSTNIVDRYGYCSQYSHNVSCWHWQSEHNHLDDQKKEKAVGQSCVISSISSQHNSCSNNIPTISLPPCPPPPQKILRD